MSQLYTCCMEQYVLYKSICTTRDKKKQTNKKQRIKEIFQTLLDFRITYKSRD